MKYSTKLGCQDHDFGNLDNDFVTFLENLKPSYLLYS